MVALLAGCATGVRIDEDVQITPFTPAAGDEGGSAAEQGAELAGDDAENAQGEAPEASGASDESPAEEDVTPAEPRDEERPGNDSEPVFPDIVPIDDVEPDEADADDADPGASPSGEPEPTDVSPDDVSPGDVSPGDANTPGPTLPEPVEPPPASDPELDSTPAVDPTEVPSPDTLPAPAHCLADWEGHACDVCSGQTQSDLLACRVYIDCYLVNDCDPLSCGGVEQACGVNQLGNGLAPKEIADAVYGCMCAP